MQKSKAAIFASGTMIAMVLILATAQAPFRQAVTTDSDGLVVAPSTFLSANAIVTNIIAGTAVAVTRNGPEVTLDVSISPDTPINVQWSTIQSKPAGLAESISSGPFSYSGGTYTWQTPAAPVANSGPKWITGLSFDSHGLVNGYILGNHVNGGVPNNYAIDLDSGYLSAGATMVLKWGDGTLRNSSDAALLAAGDAISANVLTSGTLPDARLSSAVTLDTDWDTLAELEAVVGDLATQTELDNKSYAGIYQPYDADLTDLSDGTISISKVDYTTGLNANYLTSGYVPDLRLNSTVTMDTEWQSVANIETKTGEDIITRPELSEVASTTFTDFGTVTAATLAPSTLYPATITITAAGTLTVTMDAGWSSSAKCAAIIDVYPGDTGCTFAMADVNAKYADTVDLSTGYAQRLLINRMPGGNWIVYVLIDDLLGQGL